MTLYAHRPPCGLRRVLIWGVMILLLVMPWPVWPEGPDTARVVRAIEGDTLQVYRRGRRELVRLIGVDAPMAEDPRTPGQSFKQDATGFTQRFLADKVVRLEYEGKREDLFRRTLAYMYLEDGTFVNAEIIRQGYGFVYTRVPFKYLDEFQQLEKEAREAKRGIWAEH